MPTPALDPAAEAALDEGMGICLDGAARGPDLIRWLACHPDLAADLAAALADCERVDAWIAPLRDGPPPTEHPTATNPATAGSGEPTALEFGDFELLGEVGRGGMGVVYKARQKALNKVVALKTTLAGGFPSDRDVARLRFEAEAAARLDHPHIVPIYGAGDHQGMPFFSMKFVPGGTLAGHLDRWRQDPPAAAALLAKVARAVHYAHQRGVLHRDLKPGNILLDEAGDPMVADFGLAKAVDSPSGPSASGVVVGTAPYMAPEQARGDRALTTAADVYSLGAILYELLTGRPPFRGETMYDTIRQVIEQPPVEPHRLNPEAPADLEAVCLKGLAKNPEDRYRSAADLAADLERFSRGEPVSVRPPGVLSDIVRAVRGRRESTGPATDPWLPVVVRSSAVMAATHGTIFALVAAGGAVGWVWLVLAGYFAFMGFQRLTQARRSRAFAPWERHTVTLWTGHLAATVTLAVAVLPFDPAGPADRVLPWYPPLAALYALALFVQGSISWGPYFLGSLVYMALAPALRFAGPAAPLVFAVVHVPATLILVTGAVRSARRSAAAGGAGL